MRNNNIYFIYQKADGDLLLMVYSEEKWDISILGEFKGNDILNVNVLEHEGNVHILYCTQDGKGGNYIQGISPSL